MWLRHQNANWLPAGFLAVCTVAVFSVILRNGFVSWDDPNYLLQNPFVQGFSARNLQEIFLSFRNGNYHPLPLLSYAVEYEFFGLSPRGYHAVSVALHAVNVVLAFVLLRALRLNSWAAFAAILLYAVHPMRVEAVAWVTARKDLLCTFFSLATLLVYIARSRASRTWHGWLLPVFFLLALLSKGTALVLPFLFVVIDKILVGNIDRRDVWRKWPYFLLAMVFTVLAFMARASFQGVLEEESFGLMAMPAIAVYRLVFYYIGRTFLPLPHLVSPYPAVTSFLDPAVILATVIGVALLAVLFWKRWTETPPAMGGWFFLVAIAPSLWLPVVGYSADRFAYFPSIGLAYGLGWLLERWARSRAVQVGVLTAVAVAAIGLAWMTIDKCKVWKNSITLYDDSITLFAGKDGQDKNLSRAHVNRGKAYRDEGDITAALFDFKQAVRYDPTVYKSWLYLGEMQVATGSLREAVNSFSQAINVASLEPAAWIGRAMALRRLGELDKALHDAEQALRLSPDDAFAYSARGLVWKEMGALANALADFDRVVELAPQRFEGYFNRAMVLDHLGHKERAAADFAMVLRIVPDNRTARAWLSEWQASGNRDRALEAPR